MKLIAIFITNNVTAYGGVKPLRQVALFIFVPDGNGMRYQKIVNGQETEYYYNGDQLLMENRGGSIDRIYYIYDASGVAGILIGGSYYYFDKNTLGDVVAIRNEVGVILAQYEYDAWGNHTVTDRYGNTNTSTTFIGNINPIRYRGYYYDTDTGFYYLQTRYYDPSICRFINADNYELVAYLSLGIGELNMYAYCGNNPIMYTDETGSVAVAVGGTTVGIGLMLLFVLGVEATYHPIGNTANALGDLISGAFSWFPNIRNDSRPIIIALAVDISMADLELGLNFSRERNRGHDSGFVGLGDKELDDMLKDAKRRGDTNLIKRITAELKKRGKRNTRKQRGDPHMRGVFWLLFLLETDYEDS